MSRAEAELSRYLAASRARIVKEQRDVPPDGPRILEDFDKAQAAWIGYRDAECRAVFDTWAGGTIRVAMDLDCRIRLIQLRTHTIWHDWLTYMDSTPPVLPEPRVEPDP